MSLDPQELSHQLLTTAEVEITPVEGCIKPLGIARNADTTGKNLPVYLFALLSVRLDTSYFFFSTWFSLLPQHLLYSRLIAPWKTAHPIGSSFCHFWSLVSVLTVPRRCLKMAVKRRISTPLTLNDLIKKKVSSNESPVHAQPQVYSKPVKTVQIRPTYTPKDFDFPDTTGLSDEELIPYAAEVFIRTNTVTVSMLQRMLKIGSARAARIIDRMEEKGFVGPFQGSKPRALLITQLQLDEYKRQRNL